MGPVLVSMMAMGCRWEHTIVRIGALKTLSEPYCWDTFRAGTLRQAKSGYVHGICFIEGQASGSREVEGRQYDVALDTIFHCECSKCESNQCIEVVNTQGARGCYFITDQMSPMSPPPTDARRDTYCRIEYRSPTIS